MNAKKSNPHSYWKYGFIAPILLVTLLIINKPFSVLGQDKKIELATMKGNIENEFYQASGCKELLRAVKEKDSAKVVELLKTVDPNCSYRDDGQPRSPLLAAAREGNLILGKLLVSAGAHVEFHDQNDETPIIGASGSGKLYFVKYLVVNGAEVNRKLLGDGTALMVAARGGHLETVKYLISKNADVNGQVDQDGTALIWSVRNHHYAVTKILLENGADPYLESAGDEYPMYHARKLKDQSMIDLLKKYEQNQKNPINRLN